MKKLIFAVILQIFSPILSAQEISEETYRLMNIENSKYSSPQITGSEISPYITYRLHTNGKLWTTVINNGIVGNLWGFDAPEIGHNGPDFYFPRYSRVRHAYHTALWIGGLVDGDTLVSTNLDIDWQGFWTPYESELWTDEYPQGDFEEQLNELNIYFGNEIKKSELIYKSTFVDTFKYESFVPYNIYDQRFHEPLGIKVTMTSYSWSYEYAEDFLIVDYQIENIGRNYIEDMFFGLFHTGAMHHTSELPYPLLDDLEGYLAEAPYEIEEIGMEPLKITWTVDKDGHPNGGTWGVWKSVNSFGIAPLRLPETADINNFNWWFNYPGISWGPRQKGTFDNPLRLFNGQLGAPYGDANKYYMMAHPEIDYTGYRAAANNERYGWMDTPDDLADDITDGHFVHYVSSYGAFDLAPGKKENLVFVYAVGEKAHTIPTMYRDIFDPEDPDPFVNYLDFSDLINNVRWAKRVYDNPGVDTDNDGDSGKYFIYYDPVIEDSLQVYYEGDGVPDFKGATPPPPPEIRVTSSEGKINIRWNGREVENFFDTFTLLRDFEGYRVYLARSLDINDIVLVASYDQENYNRYTWDNFRKEYKLLETPYSLDSLKILYGEDFEPLDYNRTNPLEIGNNFYFFTKVDYNEAELFDPDKIHKIYPDATNDTTDVDEEGRMRYYEYEYTIENVLPTIPYYVSVTAFDFGYPQKGLEPLESAPQLNLTKVFAQGGETAEETNKQGVYVYPNPYLINGGYADMGFENRFTDQYIERGRAIYFANLPHKCKISIFSLDGDLIKEIDHDEPEGSGTASVDYFDLITRNTQLVVSGLYYWVVESDEGNQIGKLVIIK